MSRKRLTLEEHVRRGTYQRCRHASDASTGDARPELHSYRGHLLATSELSESLGLRVVYALRANQSLDWADLPALIRRLTRG